MLFEISQNGAQYNGLCDDRLDFYWILRLTGSAKNIMILRINLWLATAIFMLVLSACIVPPAPETRRQNAHDLASRHDWQAVTLDSHPYSLQSFIPGASTRTDTLSVYIEGDGLAWLSRRRVSTDPTPAKPVGLQLALLDNRPSAYLARPCQYIRQENCEPALWTSARFSAEVIDASNQALDQLKHLFGAGQLRLIGYSGGAAIAALLAVRRQDVIQLVTIAGNLDHAAWTQHHRVSPLSKSLNPADYWQTLATVPQLHFTGQNDRNIDRHVTEAYLDRFPAENRPPVKIIEGADHDCCWAEHWPALLRIVYAGP
jgi:hypothetical protein